MRKQNIASDRRGPEAGDGFFHAVSLSGGKDSTCLLLLMIERGLPIDAVIWADTGMEFPEMYAHIAKVGEYLYQERGLHITVLRHPRGFEYFMLEFPQQKKAAIERRITMGQPLYGYGWPGVKVRWCTGQLKTHLITKEVNRLKGQHQLQQYVDIAADEAWRCKGLNYPLVDWGITEAQALQICYDRGFDFGGLYEIYHRASCWCCPLQRIGELRNLRHHHPELWARLLELDNRARAQFGPGPLGQFKQKAAPEQEPAAGTLAAAARALSRKQKPQPVEMGGEQLSLDLLSYLQTFEPGELKRCGPHEYCTRTHDSLKISNGKWCWNSRGIGGRSALDYLIKVRGMDFVGAVQTLCGYCPPPQPERPAPRPPAPFRLPTASRCPSAVVPYLQDRGIDPEIIRLCLESGILYESRKYQNCVFVGRDPAGRPRSATLRGTRDSFKLDAEGSDKRYTFCLSASGPTCPRLAVAESPIDALSLATLEKRTGGLWRNCHYLSLGGTAPNALLQFLRNHPAVNQISLCLDNDKAGLIGMDRLEQAIQADPVLAAQVTLLCRNPLPAGCGKDYNEFLTALVRMERGQQRGREAR